MTNSRTGRSALRRAKDFTIYILVGLGATAVVIWFAGRGVPRDDFGKWSGFGIFSVILLGTVVANHRRSLRRASLWLPMLLLFALHVLGYVLILGSVRHWKMIWFGLLFPVELIAFEAALTYLGRRMSR